MNFSKIYNIFYPNEIWSYANGNVIYENLHVNVYNVIYENLHVNAYNVILKNASYLYSIVLVKFFKYTMHMDGTYHTNLVYIEKKNIVQIIFQKYYKIQHNISSLFCIYPQCAHILIYIFIVL